jgi:hypothetical protein
MKIIDNIRNKIPSVKSAALEADEMTRLEASLEGVLVPIAPRQDFVQRLNRQLITSAPLARKQPAVIKSPDQNTRESLMLGAATLFGVAAVFATGFRVAITFLGVAGFLIQWANRKSLEKQAPIHTG